MRRLLQALDHTGVDAGKIQRFLEAEPAPGGGTVRDLIAADMTNQLLDALGQPPSQEGGAVQRLRQRGDWRRLDRPPPE